MTALYQARSEFTHWTPDDANRLTAHLDLVRLANACGVDTRAAVGSLSDWTNRKFQPYPDQFQRYITTQLEVPVPARLDCPKVVASYRNVNWQAFEETWWQPAAMSLTAS